MLGLVAAIGATVAIETWGFSLTAPNVSLAADPWAGGAPVGAIPSASVPTSTASRGGVSPSPGATDPANIVLQYFAAINAHDYARAWLLGGSNLGTSFDEFASGFQATESDSVTILSVQNDTVEAHIHAVDTDGTSADYVGTFAVANGEITGVSVKRVE